MPDDKYAVSFNAGVDFYKKGQIYQSLQCFADIINEGKTLSQEPTEEFVRYFANTVNYIRIISLSIQSPLEKKISAIEDEFEINTKKIKEFGDQQKNSKTLRELCVETANYISPLIDDLSIDFTDEKETTSTYKIITAVAVGVSICAAAYFLFRKKKLPEIKTAKK